MITLFSVSLNKKNVIEFYLALHNFLKYCLTRNSLTFFIKSTVMTAILFMLVKQDKIFLLRLLKQYYNKSKTENQNYDYIIIVTSFLMCLSIFSDFNRFFIVFVNFVHIRCKRPIFVNAKRSHVGGRHYIITITMENSLLLHR